MAPAARRALFSSEGRRLAPWYARRAPSSGAPPCRPPSPTYIDRIAAVASGAMRGIGHRRDMLGALRRALAALGVVALVAAAVPSAFSAAPPVPQSGAGADLDPVNRDAVQPTPHRQ